MRPLTPVVKNLLIINVIMFVIMYIAEGRGIPLQGMLVMWYFDCEFFRPYQIVSHMFMHGGLMHLFFNMFALYMFGTALESVWGPKRFLIFYFVTGLGAAALHMGAQALEIYLLTDSITVDNPFVSEAVKNIYYSRVVGASGAVFGLLLGFAMLFPNTELMIIFIPIPIKAKYFVIFYGIGTLFFGVADFSWDNIAHFAHLGGMLFGYLLIIYWRKRRNSFY